MNNTNVLKSLESKENECLVMQEYVCYDTHTNLVYNDTLKVSEIVVMQENP